MPTKVDVLGFYEMNGSPAEVNYLSFILLSVSAIVCLCEKYKHFVSSFLYFIWTILAVSGVKHFLQHKRQPIMLYNFYGFMFCRHFATNLANDWCDL